MKWKAIKYRVAFPAIAVLLPTLILTSSIELMLRSIFYVREALEEAVLFVWVFGNDHGPIPPWRSKTQIPDNQLVWKSKPNLSQNWVHVFGPAASADAQRELVRRFSPFLPDELKDEPRKLIRLNAEGFRGKDFKDEKEPGVYRIVTLGDSWTFGTTASQGNTYPALLELELNSINRDQHYEVLDLSVPGYSTYHGMILLNRAMKLDPDLLIVGYAMNETNMAGFKPVARVKRTGFSISDPLNSFVRWAKELQIAKVVQYWASLSSYHKGSPVYEPNRYAEWQASVSKNIGQFMWLTESLEEYKARITSIIGHLHSRGKHVILLYPELWVGGPYFSVLKEVAAAHNVSLVDWSNMIAEAARDRVRAKEKKFGLEPSSKHCGDISSHDMDVVFRVYQNRKERRNMYITGSSEALGLFEPNVIRMYDDGTHGDEVAGDNIWSVRIRLPSADIVRYTYTNSGDPGKWAGLDVPVLRQVVPGAFLNGMLPLDEFGKVDLYGDPWHTDEDGNMMLAKQLAQIITGRIPRPNSDGARESAHAGEATPAP